MDRSETSNRNIHSSKSSKYSDRQLREKMENPYWIPKKNSDLFHVKQIFKAEKEIKKNLSISKIKRNLMLNKLHTNQLEANFSNIKDNYFLTEITGTDRIVTTAREDEAKSILIKTNMETERTLVNPTLQIDEITEGKEKKINNAEELLKKESEKIQTKIKNMRKNKFKGVKEFIEKTRNIILTNYSMRVREERILRLEETYKNDLESYKDTVSDMIRAKKKFENEFIAKFDLYLKHLTQKKEKERNELSKLEDEKANLEADLKQLENKKLKNKEKLDLFKDYRLFQIFVKEEITLGHNPNNNEKSNTMSTFMTQIRNASIFKKKLVKQNSITKLSSEIIDTPFSAFFSHAQKEVSVTNDHISKYNGNKIIFDKPSDLTDKLKFLERNNLKLLDEYIDLNSRLNMSQRELMNMQKEEDTEDTLKKDIEDKNKQLNELIIKEKKLNEEKKSLNKTNYSNKSLTKNKILKTKLFAKINEIYQNLPQYLKENEIKRYISNSAGNKKENELEMLRVLERTFDYLNLKYKEFSENMPSDLKNFEKEIDIDRKKKITQDQKIEKERKTRNLEKAVFERQNKIYALPKRKIANDRNKPLKKEKIQVKEFKVEDIINLHELLSFEGDDYYK